MSEQNEYSIEMGGVTLNPGDRIGVYRYEKPIGKGGMAEVLLAYDPNGQPMALKVLKASRFRTGRRRFRREFRALAKLRHPNVIQVDSFGDIFGHPYFAMEYIEGIDLHTCIRDFRKKNLEQRWLHTEQILIDLAQGLNYIHSKGLVHRDLKPSNVLIDKHGTCKITDFGIVKDLEPEDDNAALVGTWAYTSPEQISGHPLDHRSDLYSLGVILYAMLTGRRPFAAENMAGYLRLHRDQLPKAPSAFIPEVPEILENICLKLLQKSPQHRFQSAQEILEALGYFVEDPVTAEEAMVWTLPFGGHIEIQNELDRILHDLKTTGGSIVQLIGEEGMGKSRLLSDIKQLAQNKDIPSFHFEINPAQGSFQAVISFAQHIAKEAGDEKIQQTITLLDKEQIESDTDLKYQLFEGIKQSLYKLLKERPQAFFFDDIQWAPSIFMELIHYLNRIFIETEKMPLLFVWSTDVEQKIASHVRNLKRLSAADIEQILEDFCEKTIGLSILAAKLHRETEGLTLFLVEFIQNMINKGQLLRGDKFRFATPPSKIAEMSFDIPPGIRQISRTKFEELSTQEKSIVELLSVAGHELDIDVLLDCLEYDEEEILDILDQLVNKQILSIRNIGLDPQYHLTRRKFGSVIYEDIEEEKRLHLHKTIAKKLEQRGAIGVASVQQIGEHYRLAKEAGKAYQFLGSALLRLWERGLASECIEIIQRAVPLVRDAKSTMENDEFLQTRLKFLVVQAELSKNRGEWHESTKTYRSMLRYAKEIKSWNYMAQAEIGLGLMALNLNQLDIGERRFQQVLNEAEECSDIPVMLTCFHYICALAWQKGDLQKCQAVAQLGLSQTQKGDLSVARAQILLSLSAVQATNGKLQEAEENMEEAASIFSKLMRKEKNATVLCNLSEVQIWQGKFSKAIQNTEIALRLSKNTMFRSGEAHAHLTLTMALYALGIYERAIPHISECLRITKDSGLSDYRIPCQYLLALIHTRLKNYNTAEQHVTDAILLCEEGDPERHLPLLRAIRAEILIHLNNTKEALQIILFVEEELEDLPWPRRLETMLTIARIRNILNQQNSAQTLARFVNKHAVSRSLWKTSLESLSLLLQIDKKDTIAYTQHLTQLEAIKRNVPEQFFESYILLHTAHKES